MGYNIHPVNRDQQYLLPPSLKDWLSQDHLVWCILDVTDTLDLTGFYKGMREDGRGGASYSPEMMVPLLIYAYTQGERSSRTIEKKCQEDVAFRIISANQQPDHSTICRFRKDHREEFEEIFVEVLRILGEAGMVKVGTLSVDGTKVKANAALSANRTYKNLTEEIEEILDEADRVDRQEDDQFGRVRRGDELPEELANPESRLKRLAECKERIEAEARQKAREKEELIRQRKEEEKRTGTKKRGRKPDPPDPTPDPDAKANPTDPESRIMKNQKGYLQAYNAQAVVTDDQIIVAAEVTNQQNDRAQLEPMVEASRSNLRDAGIEEDLRTMNADAGYWDSRAIEKVQNEQKVECLVATKSSRKMRKKWRDTHPPRGPIPEDATIEERMNRRLFSSRGRYLYKKRSQTVEPYFGDVKSNRGMDRFYLRGCEGADCEWKLMGIAQNLIKYWKRSWIKKN